MERSACYHTDKGALIDAIDGRLKKLGVEQFPNLQRLTFAQLDIFDDALEIATTGANVERREVDPDEAAEHAADCGLGSHCVHESYNRRTESWSALCCWCGDVFESDLARDEHGPYLLVSEGDPERANDRGKLRYGLLLLEAALSCGVGYSLSVFHPGHSDGLEVTDMWRAILATGNGITDIPAPSAPVLADAVLRALEDPPGALVEPRGPDSAERCDNDLSDAVHQGRENGSIDE